MRQGLFCILSSIILLSCSKDSQNIPASDYFPNSIGSHWKYKFVDSVTNTSSFVDVSIVGIKTLTGGIVATIWTYAFQNHTDTSYVYQKGDTVRFVDADQRIQNTYVLPFVLNNQWATYPDFKYDSSRVIDNRSFILHDHKFDNSYFILKYGYLPNSRWSRNEWFCPTIGMITRNDKSFFTIANEHTNTYWELLNYNLK
jgi:hypothetical protein